MKKTDHVKQKFLSFIILGIIILLSACTLVGPPKKSPFHYLYDHGLVLLLDKGILWIQFKKKDREIPKGEIYRNENSVIRYQEWYKGEKT